MNIIIADDHAIFRDSLEFMLCNKTSHKVLCTVANIQDLKNVIQQYLVDLILIDYHMPEGDTLAAAEYIKQRYDNVKLVFLTGSQASFTLKHIVSSRADGVLHKEESAEAIITAIEKVANNLRVVSTIIQEKIALVNFELTAREFHALALIVRGYTSLEIAGFMNISPRTVDKHKENIMQKMGVSNVVQLVNQAHSLKLFCEESLGSQQGS